MVKNYKKKPLNTTAANGYTPPPPTGTPIYQPEEEEDIKSEKVPITPNRRPQASLNNNAKFNRPMGGPPSSVPPMSKPINYNNSPRPMGGYNSPNSRPVNYNNNYNGGNNGNYNNNMPMSSPMMQPMNQPMNPPMNPPMNSNYQRSYYPPPMTGPPPINNGGGMYQGQGNMSNPFYPNNNSGFPRPVYNNSPPPFNPPPFTRPPLNNSYDSFNGSGPYQNNPMPVIPPRRNNYDALINNGPGYSDPPFRMPLPK